MAQKPSIPKGTRDFSPEVMVKRNYIFDILKTTFCRYGFQSLETPSMENLSTLMGKYGEEGDKLLFKILNSGDFTKKVNEHDWSNKDASKLGAQLCERGLRYDLTVPFARYVVQHRNEITFPFRRYQIQPVWRADRPQKGRYREFYQCDVDVVGSNSLLNELELFQIIDDAFLKLGVNVVIKLNNRKILAGIAEAIGEPERMMDITIALDKIEKIGLEKVNEELKDRGISESAIEKLQPVILLEGSTKEKLSKLETILKDSETGRKGIEELNTTVDYIESVNLSNEYELDLTLARGLNYYTGIIIEVKAKDAVMGSICGGGRYDDLTGIFGLKDVSGVGISFGADRIFDVMEDLKLFPENTDITTKVLFINFGKQEELFCLPILSQLRKNGINTELFPESAKMKKQMNYANTKNIPYVVIVGSEEMESGLLSVKDMVSGEQKKMKVQELIELVK
ncbi:MAG: histidine--tRNA ligase [Hyphomicrobiales bacterium]